MTARALWLAALTGCFGPSVPSGVPCTSACPGGQVCVENVCRAPGDLRDAAVDAEPELDGPVVVDACPASVDRHDEDGDGLLDACDPCPHLAGDAADSDGDQVGDACDPEPAVARQRIAFFDPFTSQLPAWSGVTNGAVIGSDVIALPGPGDTDLSVAVATRETRLEIAGTVRELIGNGPHQLALGFGYDDARGRFHYVEAFDTDNLDGDVGITEAEGNSVFKTLQDAPYGTLPLGAIRFRADSTVAGQQITFDGALGGVAFAPMSARTTTAPLLVAGPRIGITVSNLRMVLDYIVVIETDLTTVSSSRARTR